MPCRQAATPMGVDGLDNVTVPVPAKVRSETDVMLMFWALPVTIVRELQRERFGGARQRIAGDRRGYRRLAIAGGPGWNCS